MKQRDYQQALLSQSACNASALIHSLDCMAYDLWSEPGADQGTDWVNRHPLMYMYATQLSHLTGGGMIDFDRYGVALYICEMLSKIEDDEERAKLELVIGEYA